MDDECVAPKAHGAECWTPFSELPTREDVGEGLLYIVAISFFEMPILRRVLQIFFRFVLCEPFSKSTENRWSTDLDSMVWRVLILPAHRCLKPDLIFFIRISSCPPINPGLPQLLYLAPQENYSSFLQDFNKPRIHSFRKRQYTPVLKLQDKTVPHKRKGLKKEFKGKHEGGFTSSNRIDAKITSISFSQTVLIVCYGG